MFAIVFITLVSLIFSDSLVNGLETEQIPDDGSSQSNWSFGLTNIPTLGWLYNQVYSPSDLEASVQREYESMKSELEEKSKDLDEEKIPKLVVDSNESPDDQKSAKKLGDILEIIKDSSDEEKKQYLPFLENLHNTLTNNPTRFAKVFLKNMWHVVDLGIYNSSERRRNVDETKSLIDRLIDFIKDIYNAIYNFIAGRIEAGKRGAQKGWAAYERKQEGDDRIWEEEKAIKRLHEIENHYKTMKKEELAKDLISLSMQPLLPVQYYGELVRFIDKLRAEEIIDKTVLDKAFNYVDYKGKFARLHKIGIEDDEDENHKHEAEKKKQEGEKEKQVKEKEKHEGEKQEKHEGEKQEKHEGEKQEHKAR